MSMLLADPLSTVHTRYVPWRRFLAGVFDWRQGEHITILAPTGQGKTTLEEAILPLRSYVVVLGTKVVDPVLSKLERGGYARIGEWPPRYNMQRVLLWPKAKGLGADRASQREIFHRAFEAIYHEGSWCVVIDEYQYVVEELRLGQDVKTLLHQGRSSGVSIVGGSQRAAWIPVAAYANATHMFLRHTPDANDMRRLAGFGGANSVDVKAELYRLRPFEFLYLNTITGYRCVTRVERSK